MVKKVALVLSLFLAVDRVMYYKLGKNRTTEQHASGDRIRPLHQLSAQEKIIRKRLVSLTRTFLKKHVAGVLVA